MVGGQGEGKRTLVDDAVAEKFGYLGDFGGGDGGDDLAGVEDILRQLARVRPCPAHFMALLAVL